MKEGITISKEKSTHLAEDFDFLREEGLKYIEAFGSDLWTDYNSHDPGITILEMLCYAITDLGHRTAYPIQDILASEEGNLDNMHKQFFSAAKILPSAPVTENDYRKLFIDLPNVKNAWLSKANISFTVDCKESQIVRSLSNPNHKSEQFYLNGLYDIQLELDENLSKNQIRETRNQVKTVFHQNRNLCEDLSKVTVVPQQKIMICTDLDLHNDADIEAVQAQILFDLEQYLTPNIKRYSVKDLLEKGIPSEEIFEGPLLKNGFIDNEELENSKLKKEVFISDIVRVIMNIKGVKTIRKIFLNYSNPDDRPSKEVIEQQGYKWCLKIKEGHQPVLDLTHFISNKFKNQPDEDLDPPKSVFNFFKGLLPFTLNEEKQNRRDLLLKELHDNERALLEAVSNTFLDLPMPLGKYRNVSDYVTIQNDFPQAYGIGQAGLPSHATKERKAKAKQLKAYLLFFDQLLANYFSQLSNISKLLSTNSTERKTFFAQIVNGLKGFEDLYENFEELEIDLDTAIGEKDETIDSDIFSQRKNKLLDHLLARFGESFNDYAMLMHGLFDTRPANLELIEDKNQFIKEYGILSKNRAKGFDYCNEFRVNENGEQVPNKMWYTQKDAGMPIDEINVSGIVHRAARLAGIPNYKRRNLAHIEYDLYQERDDDNKDELRWRVIDTSNSKILLSGSVQYLDENSAIAEMRESVNLAMNLENYEMLETIDNRFYFNIVNAEGEVVARRIEYFKTPDLRMDAMIFLKRFLEEKFSDEGFYVIEHQMLRPRKSTDNFLPVCTDSECTTCETIDPYSFRVSIIFPGFTPRSSNIDFRNHMEQIIRSELPAHIMARICWVGEKHMGSVEKHYKKWLTYNQKHFNTPRLTNKSLNELIAVLNDIHTVYPPGTLHDCDDGDDENPVVLGRTHLGNQEQIIETDNEV